LDCGAESAHHRESTRESAGVATPLPR
jgi:hypothetical protein